MSALRPELLNLTALHLFVRVAERRYIKDVAQEEGLTPSAVSQAIAKLEADLGVELFLHDARPLKLTALGQALLQEAPHLLAAARELKLRLSERSLSDLTIRLGMSESVTATLSPWLIAELSAQVGALTTVSLLTKPLIEALREERIDVAVVPDGLLQEDRWHRTPVYVEDFLLVTSKALSHASSFATQSLASLLPTLAQAPFVGYAASGSSDAQEVERILRSLNLKPERRLTVSSSYALVGLISQMGGWSIVPPTNFWCGRQFVEDCDVAAYPAIRSTRTMWVVTDAMRYREDPSVVQVVVKALHHVLETQMRGELLRVSPMLARHCRLLEVA